MRKLHILAALAAFLLTLPVFAGPASKIYDDRAKCTVARYGLGECAAGLEDDTVALLVGRSLVCEQWVTTDLDEIIGTNNGGDADWFCAGRDTSTDSDGDGIDSSVWSCKKFFREYAWGEIVREARVREVKRLRALLQADQEAQVEAIPDPMGEE